MIALSGRQYLFLLWLAVLSALPQLASADEIIDGRSTPVTVRHAMHSCPPGRYVVGVRVDRNELLCSSDFPAPQLSQEYVNGDDEPANQRQGMHACPAGSGVTGLHVANNWLSCAPLSGGVQREVLDGPPPTVRADMHACPSGYALTGIHVGNNQFLCGAPPPAVPDVKVQVTPPQQSVPWGQNATYTIELSSINGYSNVVQLTATNVPDGSSVTFTPAAIAVPSGAAATSTMTVATTEGATHVGEKTITVVATGPALSTKREPAKLKIQRVSGSFTRLYPLNTNVDQPCGGSVLGHVSGFQVTFTSPLGSETAQSSAGYKISNHHCRTGFVLVTGGHYVNLYNLLFPPTTGAAGIHSHYNHHVDALDAWVSPDESIVAVVGAAAPPNRSLVLLDLVTRSQSAPVQFSGALNYLTLSGDQVTTDAWPHAISLP